MMSYVLGELSPAAADRLVDRAWALASQVLVIVTDGNDNTSNINLEELMRKAQQSDVLIYSIGILSEEEPREARLARMKDIIRQRQKERNGEGNPGGQ